LRIRFNRSAVDNKMQARRFAGFWEGGVGAARESPVFGPVGPALTDGCCARGLTRNMRESAIQVFARKDVCLARIHGECGLGRRVFFRGGAEAGRWSGFTWWMGLGVLDPLMSSGRSHDTEVGTPGKGPGPGSAQCRIGCSLSNQSYGAGIAGGGTAPGRGLRTPPGCSPRQERFRPNYFAMFRYGTACGLPRAL